MAKKPTPAATPLQALAATVTAAPVTEKPTAAPVAVAVPAGCTKAVAAALQTVAAKHGGYVAQATAAAAAGLPPSLVAGLPRHVAATIPADWQNVRLVTGKSYKARQHNAAWAAAMTACVNAAGEEGATVADCVAATLAPTLPPGSGWHSVKAYIGRGWFVRK
jgi:hypothetical protein